MVWSGGGVQGRADLRWVNAGDPKTLDPGQMSWGQDIRLANALWEGLYRFDSTRMQPQPGVAERVDISDDRTTYTFHLRPAARWSNGDPVTAHDFAFAWKRVLDQPASYTSLLYYIDGAQAYADAMRRAHAAFAADPDAAGIAIPSFGDVGIAAIDERTFRVRLRHPVPFFLDLCAFPTFFPLHEKSIPPRLIERHARTGAIQLRQGFTKPPLVSNGPFVMADWQYKQRIRLRRNERYWDAAGVRLETIDVVSAEDGFAAFQMYETGAVDWIADVHPEVAAKLKQAGRDDFKITTGFGTYYYEFLTEPALPDGRPNPFHDRRVRQAFAMAIDKQAITRNIVTTGETPADTYIPRGIFDGYASPGGLQYDAAGARALLADAGYPQGRGFPQVTLLYNTNAGHERIAEYVRRQWLDNLGVMVSLEGVEVKTFGTLKEQKKFHVCRASWIGDYSDPSTFTDKYLSFSENNDAGWKNVEYDRLCAAAAREPDSARRMRLLQQAEALLLDDAAVVPIYSYVNRVLQKPHVKGLEPNPRNQQDFKRVWVEKRQ
jgi:oligopeptide transport system substrate-binding protein